MKDQESTISERPSTTGEHIIDMIQRSLRGNPESPLSLHRKQEGLQMHLHDPMKHYPLVQPRGYYRPLIAEIADTNTRGYTRSCQIETRAYHGSKHIEVWNVLDSRITTLPGNVQFEMYFTTQRNKHSPETSIQEQAFVLTAQLGKDTGTNGWDMTSDSWVSATHARFFRQPDGSIARCYGVIRQSEDHNKSEFIPLMTQSEHFETIVDVVEDETEQKRINEYFELGLAKVGVRDTSLDKLVDMPINES